MKFNLYELYRLVLFFPKRLKSQLCQPEVHLSERDADDGYHQYQSCNEILQGYVQASEYDPDDVS